MINTEVKTLTDVFDKIKKMGESHGWEKLNEYKLSISFTKVKGNNPKTVLTVFFKEDVITNRVYNTKTYMNHPTKGRTNLERIGLTTRQLRDVFANPRCHTGKGFHQNKKNNKKK